MPELSIHVNGHRPVPWGCNEWAWRAAVAREARIAGAVLAPVSQVASFSVALLFRMREERLQYADLDNLAKPVLDTLFQSRHSQVKDASLAGALFCVDDDRVFRLNLEKQLARDAADEGVDISVSW